MDYYPRVTVCNGYQAIPDTVEDSMSDEFQDRKEKEGLSSAVLPIVSDLSVFLTNS